MKATIYLMTVLCFLYSCSGNSSDSTQPEEPQTDVPANDTTEATDPEQTTDAPIITTITLAEKRSYPVAFGEAWTYINDLNNWPKMTREAMSCELNGEELSCDAQELGKVSISVVTLNAESKMFELSMTSEEGKFEDGSIQLWVSANGENNCVIRSEYSCSSNQENKELVRSQLQQAMIQQLDNLGATLQ